MASCVGQNATTMSLWLLEQNHSNNYLVSTIVANLSMDLIDKSMNSSSWMTRQERMSLPRFWQLFEGQSLTLIKPDCSGAVALGRQLTLFHEQSLPQPSYCETGRTLPPCDHICEEKWRKHNVEISLRSLLRFTFHWNSKGLRAAGVHVLALQWGKKMKCFNWKYCVKASNK